MILRSLGIRYIRLQQYLEITRNDQYSGSIFRGSVALVGDGKLARITTTVLVTLDTERTTLVMHQLCKQNSIKMFHKFYTIWFYMKIQVRALLSNYATKKQVKHGQNSATNKTNKTHHGLFKVLWYR